MPEVSAALVEIVILYKRSQEVRWAPINHERIHAWWSEAARRRKALSDALDAAAAITRNDAASASEMTAAPPSQPRHGDPPKLGAPPTLDDLLRYHEWLNAK